MRLHAPTCMHAVQWGCLPMHMVAFPRKSTDSAAHTLEAWPCWELHGNAAGGSLAVLRAAWHCGWRKPGRVESCMAIRLEEAQCRQQSAAEADNTRLLPPQWSLCQAVMRLLFLLTIEAALRASCPVAAHCTGVGFYGEQHQLICVCMRAHTTTTAASKGTRWCWTAGKACFAGHALLG